MRKKCYCCSDTLGISLYSTLELITIKYLRFSQMSQYSILCPGYLASRCQKCQFLDEFIATNETQTVHYMYYAHYRSHTIFTNSNKSLYL